VAIGGVTLDRVADVAASGAAGIAAIGLFADAASAGGAAVNAGAAYATLVARLRAGFASRAAH
jgi:thiamine monophosphate synthase